MGCVNMQPMEIRTSRPAFTAALGQDGQGAAFLAFVATDTGTAALRVVPLDECGALAAPAERVAQAPGILEAHLASDEAGRLLAIWSQPSSGGVMQLHESTRLAVGKWTAPRPLSSLPGASFAATVIRDAAGRPWCLFQGGANGQQQVHVTWKAGGQWAFPQRITDGDGHTFAPAACRFGQGIRAVWDGRIDGRYGVYMREFEIEPRTGRYEPQATVACAEGLLCGASIIALNDEHSLLVYEDAQPDWGRRNRVIRADREEMTAGNFLHARRHLRAVRIGPEGQALLADDLDAHLEAALPSPSRGSACLGRDGRGTVFLAYRQIVDLRSALPERGFVQALTCWRDGAWQPPVVLQDGGGLSRMPASFLTRADGRLLLAYAERRAEEFAVRVVEVSGPGRAGGATAETWPAAGAFAPMRLTEPDPPRRTAPLTLNGSPDDPVLLWGDLHRHTEISACRWWIEGMPQEAYRYALQAANLDFLALTDHAWYLQNRDARALDFLLACAYGLPGRFTTFCAYEANFEPGEGHVVVLSGDMDPEVPVFRDRAELFDRLVGTGAVVVPHHMGDPAFPYGWAGHSDALAPVAEVFQPYRTAFEQPGAPAPSTAWADEGNAAVPESTMLHAWRAGLKVGVVASSDHLSTGGAFAGVWARTNTRDAILEALRRRHCFAASARIELAFWAGAHFMGDAADLPPDGPREVTVRVRCRGEAALDRAELLCDGEVVHTFRPARRGRSLDARVTVPVPPGEHFHYARVFQQDGQMAWSSPIWLR